MWVITFKGKPATIEKIYDVERDMQGVERQERGTYIAAKTKSQTIEMFLYHIGFTWAERAKGIDVKKFN